MAMNAMMVVPKFHVHLFITRQRLVERGVGADALVPTWCDQHQVTKIIGRVQQPEDPSILKHQVNQHFLVIQ